jgi:hypothetical protein
MPSTHALPSSDRLPRRAFLVGASLSALGGASGCGWILYPERRGNRSGEVDIGVLVVDLLWLLPGIVPGAVCLAVDFTSGAIYRKPQTAVRRPAGATDHVTARVGLDERVVAEATGSPEEALELRWREDVVPAHAHAHGILRLDGAFGGTARAPLGDLVDMPR